MADVHSKEVRSYNMSKIRGKDTKPEILVRKYLFSNGLRFRLHVKNLAGRPDIVLPRYKTAIFVHGCFWHGHADCRYGVIPKTRTEWWKEKISGNIQRDVKNEEILRSEGWKIIVLWECQLKKDRLDATLEKCLGEIKTLDFGGK